MLQSVEDRFLPHDRQLPRRCEAPRPRLQEHHDKRPLPQLGRRQRQRPAICRDSADVYGGLGGDGWRIGMTKKAVKGMAIESEAIVP